MDGHWTRKGEAIVTDKVAAELEALQRARGQALNVRPARRSVTKQSMQIPS